MKSLVTALIILLMTSIKSPADQSAAQTDTALFAGGCFWCMETPFLELPGVKQVDAGYTGGHTINPNYEEVSSGSTGHYESVRVIFYTAKVSYDKLLDVFWRNIDPTDKGGQFVDRGSQYQTAIFYLNDSQKMIAEKSKQSLESSGRFSKPIATKIVKATPFYRAEEYHQEYFRKQPGHYEMYRSASGRDNFIRKTWGEEKEGAMSQIKVPYIKLTEPELRQQLTQLQYEVTQEKSTEPAFNNEYWNNHREGIYVDIVSGEPLFSSLDKFDSDCGWPSFSKPIEQNKVVTKTDLSHFMMRLEVRSKTADSHLGHLFNDGPGPTHARYCINSASLRFIPRKDLAKEGYAEYEKLFEK